jgi:hypothetical protein
LSRSRRRSGCWAIDPKYSNKQALIRNYQWYIDHLQDFEGRSGVSHRVPWKQGALALAKSFSKNLKREASAAAQAGKILLWLQCSLWNTDKRR